MSLRIQEQLFQELKKVARTEGRTVSGQVVHMIRGTVPAPPLPAPKGRRRWLGRYAGVDTPTICSTIRPRASPGEAPRAASAPPGK